MRLFVFLTCLIGGSSVIANDVPGLTKTRPTQGRFVETEKGFMVPYTAKIPGTEIPFEMIPVPGGEFLLGSPEIEPGRNSDEGPQIRVSVRPFWMARNEIRWEEYHEYMALYGAFKRFESARIRVVKEENQIDAITAPTEIYEVNFVYEFGNEPQMPAVTMTQYAARQYTKWLSGITGQQYRLPTEVEWEYAARGGTTTMYSFGNTPRQLGEHARFAGNSQDQGPRKVGEGPPNPFGLCDMYGNVGEWCLDEKQPGGYEHLQKLAEKNPIRPLTALETFFTPKTVFTRIVRGGTWQSSEWECRSASRSGSDDKVWKDADPDLPKSAWWYTDEFTRGVGFRIMRSLDEVPRPQMEIYWSADTDDLRLDLSGSVTGGRGVYGLVDRDLPEAVKKIRVEKP